MSESLDRRAEIAKLARLLRRPASELGYLEVVPSGELRVLRDAVTETLFSSGDGALRTLARASRVLPVGLVANLAENVFGPVLSARVAGVIEPDRAVELAGKLPTPFLADVAVELDPRRAHEVIARIEPERIGEVAAELMNRGEFVTMGCFVGHLERPAILAALEAMGDSALLQTAFVLENKDSVQELVALLPEPRLQRVIDAATAEGLWPETLGLLAYLDETQRRRMIGTASGRGEDVLSGLIEAADAEAMWDVVLPLTTLMSSEQLERFAALASLQRPGVLEAIVDVAVEDDELWAQLLPLVARLPEACQARVVARVRALPVDHAALLDRARAAGLEDQLGPLESALGA